jgi:hypothetical protein
MKKPSMRRESKLPVILALVLLGCVALALAGLPWLRREHEALIYLQNHVELAAAPGEPVLVDDRCLGFALGKIGSRLADHPEAVFTAAGVRGLGDQEAVLVARPGDPLLVSLRATGYRVTPDASGDVPWDPTADGSALCGRAAVRIFFVLPPDSSGAIPSKP